MYDYLGFFELFLWIMFVVLEHGLAKVYADDKSTTIVCEIFKLAGFTMKPAAEYMAIVACFILRLFFGSVVVPAIIAVLAVQLALSTLVLKYFITVDSAYN